MRIKYGKVKWGYRDSYGNEILREIIHDWLVNFRDVLLKRDAKDMCLGVPQAMLPNDVQDGTIPEEDIEQGLANWIATIDKMIDGFSEYEYIPYDVDFLGYEVSEDEDGNKIMAFTVTDEDKYEAYTEALKQRELELEEGRNLFAQHFDSLWW